MKRKFWNWVRDADSGERTLVLNGEISDETWYGDEVTPGLFREELAGGAGDITVWINSPGGDCFAAAQIYNMLAAYPGKVTVKVDAVAASAATVVAMAGDEIVMPENAFLMIHDPAGLVMGTAEDMRAMAEALDALVQAQLSARAAARAARDYAAADAIRDQLHAVGISIEDTSTGARWSLTKGEH